MIELTPAPARPLPSCIGVKVKMIVCYDKGDEPMKKYNDFMEEKKREGWIVLDACYCDWGAFHEYQFIFERGPKP